MKTLLNPTSLTKPSGYTNGVLTEGGRVLFLAGQTGLNAEGKIIAPDLLAQYQQALSNLKAVVEEASGQMTDIVKLTLYITNKADYQAHLKPLGAIHRAFFGRYYPAITLVEVKSLWDVEAQVEIDGIAVIY